MAEQGGACVDASHPSASGQQFGRVVAGTATEIEDVRTCDVTGERQHCRPIGVRVVGADGGVLCEEFTELVVVPGPRRHPSTIPDRSADPQPVSPGGTPLALSSWPRPLLVVGEDSAVHAIHGDRAAVGEDPLRSGVAEWDADADDRFGVVAGHHVDDRVALLLA